MLIALNMFLAVPLTDLNSAELSAKKHRKARFNHTAVHSVLLYLNTLQKSANCRMSDCCYLYYSISIMLFHHKVRRTSGEA